MHYTKNTNSSQQENGQNRPSSLLFYAHHQREAPEVVVRIVVPVPVVAVEPVAVEPEIQAIAVGVHGRCRVPSLPLPFVR